MKFFVGEQKIFLFSKYAVSKDTFLYLEVLGRELIPQGTPVKWFEVVEDMKASKKVININLSHS